MKTTSQNENENSLKLAKGARPMGPQKKLLKSLSMKPVRSMKKMNSFKVRPIVIGLTPKETL